MLSPEGLLADPEEAEFEQRLQEEFRLAREMNADICCTCVGRCTCDEEIKCA